MRLWSFSLFDFCSCYYVCTILVFIQSHLSCSKLFFSTFINSAVSNSSMFWKLPLRNAKNIMKIYFLHLISSVFDSKIQFCCCLFLEYATGLLIHLFCLFLPLLKIPKENDPIFPFYCFSLVKKKICYSWGSNLLGKTAASCWSWKLLLQLSCSIMQLYENNWLTFNLQTQQMIRQNRWWFWHSWQVMIFYSANIVLKQFQNF